MIKIATAQIDVIPGNIRENWKQIEKEIINAFDQIGLNEISTSYGILKKITDEDKISLVIQLK